MSKLHTHTHTHTRPLTFTPMAKLFLIFLYCTIVSSAAQKEGDDFSLCAISLTREPSCLPGDFFFTWTGTLGGSGDWTATRECWHLPTALQGDEASGPGWFGFVFVFPSLLAKHKYSHSNWFRIYLNQQKFWVMGNRAKHSANFLNAQM